MPREAPQAHASGIRRGSGGGVVMVGLTGAMGAGKSTALAMFRERGATVVSSDQMVHSLYRRPDVKDRLCDHFGTVIFDAHGEVDRRRLGERVQSDRAALRFLEELSHPLVAEEIERLAARAGCALVVCEVPLLYEAGFERLFDLVVSIEAPHQLRWGRSSRRFEPEIFRELDNLQWTSDRRVAASDLSFVNDGDRDALKAFVDSVVERAGHLAAERVGPGDPGRRG